MSRKRDAVSRAVARISQRNNDVARLENIDHIGVAQQECKHSSIYGNWTDVGRWKSVRNDEKRLSYVYPSQLRKDTPSKEMVHQKDDSDDEDAATLVRDWDSHVLSGRSWRLS